MFRWLPYPFIRFTLVFIAGILLTRHFSWHLPTYGFLFIAACYTALAFGIPKQLRYRWSSLTGLVGLLWLLAASFFYAQYRQDDRSPFHLAQLSEPYTHYVATVIAPGETKANSYSTLADVSLLVRKDSMTQVSTLPAKGKVIIYQPKADSLHRLTYGDKILIKGKAQLVKPPTNPHEFNYQQFLVNQHIYHQHYLPREQWVMQERGIVNPVLSFAYAMRKSCQAIFEQGIHNKQARGIALALVLGIKTGLDDEIRNAYAAAGAMHVLAVSGLHVGIIYLVLSFLLRPLERGGRWGVVLKTILCLLALWGYALLTGLSPSVMRAATMFSFIIVAEASRRQTNIYNTIAASAFFLLLYDPFLIMSVGFQLSYLAVLGIVYLQPKIYQWFTPNNKWLDWLWGLTAVSIAAQLATFPLGLYYFQQFPLYFWLSNILVIPAAYLILSLGLLCFALGFAVPALLVYPSYLLEKSIIFVNQGVMAIEQLPFSVFKNVYFSTEETLLFYVAILSLLMLFYFRRFRYVWMFSACLLFALTLRLAHVYEQYQEKSITFYNVSKESRIDLTKGRNTYHLGKPDKKAMYHMASNQVFKGGVTTFLDKNRMDEALASQHRDNLHFLVWNGRKVVSITEPFSQNYALQNKLKVDAVIISNNALKSIDKLNQYFEYGRLIIDSSNTFYHAAKLAEEAKELKIPYHCVPLQGAFEYMID
ncbi:competence protein ComEC [Catalinimonas alkaloidigena]|uniref:ComEC/Rec2 family competence protein n=1 Tax=Catalinimonas alkaloidigena TaxID=1075417 RepID=UPI00240606EE|nr:ComEC/Rec2 family competence protein [Catalinimonas alkaloidigena]MDF9799055.1 competence protein ComEC [Catalinimonas alkaloidigena]